MPNLTYGTTSFSRNRGNFPDIPVINMVAEEVSTESGTALISRPGLENTGTSMGAGPVKALYRLDGVLSGGLFGISGTHLYQDGTDLGAIDGTGHACMGGYADRVFANAGANVWQWNGTALTSLTLPDTFQVLSLCVGASRLVIIDKGTGRFYWSDPLTSTLPVLSFATAENSPDNLLDCLFIGDTLMLFGSRTIEFWPINSDATLPFQPLVGRTLHTGIRDTGCLTQWNNSFAWITDNNVICVSDPQNRVSFAGLEEKLTASTSAKLWTFVLDSNEYLAVTLDTETWVLNPKSSQWSNFSSSGKTNWVPNCYADGVFGSAFDGHLVQWSDDYEDFGGTLERRFRAGMALDTGTTPLYSVVLRTNPGRTPFLTGDYADPTVELRTSRDGGVSWSEWRPRSLGVQGKVRKNVSWKSLGFFSNPGLLVEFRVTDPVPFRISNVVANDPYGGI